VDAIHTRSDHIQNHCEIVVPAANAGEALARLFLSDKVRITLAGAAAELLVLIFIWYIAIRTTKLMGYFKTEPQKPDQN